MTAKKMVAILITAAILYAAYLHLKPGDPAQIHIENSFNSIGGELQIPREQVAGVLEAALGGKKEDLKKSVVKLMHPGGTATSGAITIDGNEALTIPAEVIERVPPQYEKAEEEETFKDFPGAQMTVRALDLDNPTRGWWAIVPDVAIDKRVTLKVSEDIDLRTVPVGKYLYADITVFYKTDRRGTKTPKRYLLRKIVSKPQETVETLRE